MVIVAVIEDDLSVLDALGLLIEHQGWEVRTYSTGADFLRDLKANDRIDCVILDSHLGGPDGDEVARRLIGSKIPIIGLTARPESHVTRRLEMLNPVVMLTKPTQPDELIDWIEKSLPSQPGNR